MKRLILTCLLIASVNTASFAAEADHASSPRALLAYMKVQPGTEAQFLDAAQNVLAESRKEPGNLAYILQRSVTDPQEFVLYELFKSDADL